MGVRFTAHALKKFDVLAMHGVSIPRRKVLETVENPDRIDYSRAPLLIAQSEFDATRVLRVVYREKKGEIIVITFYPGRKSQYEKK